MKEILNMKSLWLCVLCAVLMGSCQNGCTFSKVMKSESKTEKIGTRKLEITASLLKSRNVRYIWRTQQFTSSAAYYSVKVDAAIDTNALHLDWYFSADKGEDLKPFLDKTSLKTKRDNRYFTLEYQDNKAWTCLFQILGNGAVIASPYQEDFLKGKFVLESLPDEKRFIADLLKDPAFFRKSRHPQMLADYFAGLKLDEAQCIQLLEHVGEGTDNLADAYFTEARLKNLKYDYPKFKEKALALSVSKLESAAASQMDPYLALVLRLGDANVFAKVDRIVCNKWGDAGFDDAMNNYLKTRLTRPSKAMMQKDLRDELLARCQTSIDRTIAKDEKYSSFYVKNYVKPENALQYMLWTNNKPYIEKYANFKIANANDDAEMEMNTLVSDYYDKLSPATQQKILTFCKQQFQKRMQEDNKMDAADWYNMMDLRMSCAEMKPYFKQYKDKHQTTVFLKKEPKC